MLSPRTATILKSIVEQYITKQVPVPSQCILNEYNLGVSPATIRNEMAYLEEGGYITRPHTSAGGIPSDKGYRCYVESLINLQLSLVEQRLITHLFHQVEKDMEEWLRLAAAVIARRVQNVAVVTQPKAPDCRLKHLELVTLRDSLALVILVLHGARVKQQLAEIEQAITQSEMSTISTKLNNIYHDMTCSQLQDKVVTLTPVERQVVDIIIKMMEAEDERQYNEPYLDGLHFIFNQPEFAHGDRLQELMRTVEHKNLLRVIVPRNLNTREVAVTIGKENEAEVVHDFSIVISQYGVRNGAVGTIGVFGPTRMSYAQAIPTVGYLSTVLSRLVAELYEKELEEEVTDDRAK
ncbi:heat-inducible transcriptional repressor HrcA [Chloroflexota bacterium]